MRRAHLIAAGLALAGLAGCAPRHVFSRLGNPDHTLVATVDYVGHYFGLSKDAVVSVQENGGLASSVATFRNIERMEVSWLGPDDLNICQTGQVIGFRKAVTLNTSKGPRTVHIRYGC